MWPFKTKSQNMEQKASGAAPNIAAWTIGNPVWKEKNYLTYSKEGYAENPIAHQCVSIISKAAGSIPILLLDENDKEVTKHPILDLLSKPAPDSAENKSGAALETSAYCDAEWGEYYIGKRIQASQAELWPRDAGKDTDGTTSLDLLDADDLTITGIPVALQNACAELAARAVSSSLSQDTDMGQRIKRSDKGLGTLKKSIEYFDNGVRASEKSFGMVSGILAPILNGSQPTASNATWHWR